MPFFIFFKAPAGTLETLFITPLSPLEAESGVSINADLIFGLHLDSDPLSVNLNSINVDWQAVEAVIAGLPQDGYHITTHLGIFDGHLGYIVIVKETSEIVTESPIPITISNTGSALTDHQVRLHRPFLSGQEVEFYEDAALSSPIPFWREDPETWWVKISLPADGTKTVYAAFGGAIVGGDGYGEQVFELFDAFDNGVIDSSKWTVSGSGFSESGGQLLGGTQSDTNYIRSVQTFSSPVIVQTQITETDPAENGFTTIGFWNHSTDQLTILSHNGTSYYRNDGSWVNFGFSGLNAGPIIDEVWMTGTQGRVRRTSSDASYDSGLFSNTLNGETLFLGARGDAATNYNGQVYAAAWDYIHVRKYTDNEVIVVEQGQVDYAKNSNKEISVSIFAASTDNSASATKSYSYITGAAKSYPVHYQFGAAPSGRFRLLTTPIESAHKIGDYTVISSEFSTYNDLVVTGSFANIVPQQETVSALKSFSEQELADFIADNEVRLAQVRGQSSPVPTFLGPKFGATSRSPHNRQIGPIKIQPQSETFKYDDSTLFLASSSTISPDMGGSQTFSSFSIKSGTLPDGLSIDPDTGVISGTPTSTGLLSGTPAGEYRDIVVQAEIDGNTKSSEPFDIIVKGVSLPMPEHYFAFDSSWVVPATGKLLGLGNRTINGNVNGTVNFVSSPIGEQIELPGTSGNWVDFTEAEDIAHPSSLTMCVTATPDDVLNNRQVITFGLSDAGGTDAYKGVNISVGSAAERARFYIGGADGKESFPTSTSTISPGQRVHILGAFDDPGNRQEIWIDGFMEAFLTPSFSVVYDLSTGIEFARHPQFDTRYWDGKIDEAAIWSLFLDDDQKATVGWLSKTNRSLSSWIKGEPPSQPIYNDQVLVQGTSISFMPDVASTDSEGGNITYIEYDQLPAGLSLNSSTGEISGTPTTVAYAQYRVAVTDGMNLTVGPAFSIAVGATMPAPVAYWSFDSDNYADESGNGHDGSASGTTFFDGSVQRAVAFDASTSYVSVPHGSYSLNQAVWCCHFRGTQQLATIMSKADNASGADNGNILHLGKSGTLATDGQLAFTTKTTTSTNYIITSNQTIYNDNNWHDVVIEYDRVGGTGSMLVDGTDSASGSVAPSGLTTTGPLRFGDPLFPSSNNWVAPNSIDEVVIFSSLTADQKATYNVLRLAGVPLRDWL